MERQSNEPDTKLIPYFSPLKSTCDLDLGDRDVGLSHDTLSHDGEHLCQIISKSIIERQSYGQHKKIIPCYF